MKWFYMSYPLSSYASDEGYSNADSLSGIFQQTLKEPSVSDKFCPDG